MRLIILALVTLLASPLALAATLQVTGTATSAGESEEFIAFLSVEEFDIAGSGVPNGTAVTTSGTATVYIGESIIVTDLPWNAALTDNSPSDTTFLQFGTNVSSALFSQTGGEGLSLFTVSDINTPQKAVSQAIRDGELSFFANNATTRYDVAVDAVTTVPLPAAAWLFVYALVGLAGLGRFQRRSGVHTRQRPANTGLPALCAA